MLKKDIVRRVAAETAFNKDQVSEIFDKFIEAIKDGMKQGEKIQFNGFGTFKPTLRAARIGRNPSTGEEIQIPEKKGYILALSKQMREEINV